jgi:hypothetical protein
MSCHVMSCYVRSYAQSSWYAHYRASDEMVREMGLQPELGDRCLGVFVLGAISPELSIRAARLPMSEVVTWK